MYGAEAEKLKTLTDLVLSHHSKDNSTWSLQVLMVMTAVNPLNITVATKKQFNKKHLTLKTKLNRMTP